MAVHFTSRERPDFVLWLYMFLGDTGQSFSDVQVCRDGRDWTVTVHEESEPRARELLRSSGLRGEFGSGDATGDPVSIHELVVGIWVRHDPIKLLAEPAQPLYDVSDLPLARAVYLNRHGDYILEAVAEAQNRAVVDRLLASRAAGLTACAIRQSDETTAESPSRFLWRVRGGAPTLDVLQAAERVWWGVPDEEGTEIFEEWPYTLRSLEAFKALGRSKDLLLLCAKNPEVIRVKGRSGQPVFEPLVDVVGLNVPPVRAPLREFREEKQQLSLTVDLRLTSKPPTDLRARRIAELEGEIRSLCEIADNLKDEEEEDAIAFRDRIVEPLYLYPSAPGGVPNEIHRLLLEWPDTKDSLGALYHSRLSGDSMPEVFASGHDWHVLTTATALGLSRENTGRRSTGSRLGRYEPRSSAYCTYELALDWAYHRLRLFMPSKKGLMLYPELRPRHGVNRLRTLLTPEGVEGDCLFVLVPNRRTGRGGFDVVCVPVAEMRPLFGSEGARFVASNWTCDSVRLHGARVPAEDVARSRDQVRGAIGTALDRSLWLECVGIRTALEGLLTGAMEAITREYETRLATYEGDATELHTRAEAARESLVAMRGNLDGALAGVEGFGAKCSEAVGKVRDLLWRSDGIQREYVKVREELKDLQALKEEIQALQDKCDKLHTGL